MSAECHKCGTDLVYSSWPIGHCPNCKADIKIKDVEKELAELKQEIKNLKSNIEELKKLEEL